MLVYHQPRPPTSTVYHEDCCYVHPPINLLADSSGHLPYASVLRGACHQLSTLFLRKSCNRPSTVCECHTSATQAGIQFALCRITRKLTISSILPGLWVISGLRDGWIQWSLTHGRSPQPTRPVKVEALSRTVQLLSTVVFECARSLSPPPPILAAQGANSG